jgi:hypothetical protein
MAGQHLPCHVLGNEAAERGSDELPFAEPGSHQVEVPAQDAEFVLARDVDAGTQLAQGDLRRRMGDDAERIAHAAAHHERRGDNAQR